MAQAKTVSVYECDGCGFLVQGTPDSDPKGFHGNVKEVHPDGNSGPSQWYAHSDRCIKKAIMSVLGLE